MAELALYKKLSPRGEVAEALRVAGKAAGRNNLVAYAVGGAPRDYLLGIEPREADVVVESAGGGAKLAEALHREEGFSRPVVYKRFGTAMTRRGEGGVALEFVAARAENYRSESRKPSEVRPATIFEDAARRDFTVNAFLMRIDETRFGEVLDPLDGAAARDFEARVLRTPGDPASTIEEDPLRALRAVRFATARPQFSIDPDLAEAIGRKAGRLAIVSPERIQEELVKILTAEKPSAGLRLMAYTGLLMEILPELAEGIGTAQDIRYHREDVFSHTLSVLDMVRPDPVLRLAALLHDVAKPRCRARHAQRGHDTFYDHDKLGAEMAAQRLSRLRFPRDLVERVASLVRNHMVNYRSEWTDKALRRLVRRLGDTMELQYELALADVRSMAPGYNEPKMLEELRSRIEALGVESIRRMDSPLDGKEIMALLGLAPGPEVGQAKEILVDAVIDGELLESDKEGAARLLGERWKNRPG